MRFIRKIWKQGDSLAITIPKPLLDWLNANEGSTVILEDDEGRFGKHMHFWVANPEQLEELNRTPRGDKK